MSTTLRFPIFRKCALGLIFCFNFVSSIILVVSIVRRGQDNFLSYQFGVALMDVSSLFFVGTFVLFSFTQFGSDANRERLRNLCVFSMTFIASAVSLLLLFLRLFNAPGSKDLYHDYNGEGGASTAGGLLFMGTSTTLLAISGMIIAAIGPRRTQQDGKEATDEQNSGVDMEQGWSTVDLKS
ncbi:hypothetical protein D9613_002759 [Agrocybe pediades]|uniref:Uncharacterized protein n=1 Tax=Agrocybe pediades TaxID=84607 RepID=A0A8H4VLP4_9AGAR|nr:hypothetical protein D9613_002759 [Agrocybe pediades]